MNLLEALEKKRALESVIQDKTESLKTHLQNQKTLSQILTKIDSLIDEFYTLERSIDNKYNSTLISTSESISDVISYIDGIAHKTEVLKFLLLESNKNKIKTGQKIEIDETNVMASISRYEELKNILIKKVKDVCIKTFITDQE